MANKLLTFDELCSRVDAIITEQAKQAGVSEDELRRALLEAYPYGMVG